MVEFRVCQFADLVADAQENDRIEELKSIGLTKVNGKKTEDGKTISYKRQRTYLEIKKIYYQRFYPSMLPKARPKPKTIYDLLEEL